MNRNLMQTSSRRREEESERPRERKRRRRRVRRVALFSMFRTSRDRQKSAPASSPDAGAICFSLVLISINARDSPLSKPPSPAETQKICAQSHPLSRSISNLSPHLPSSPQILRSEGI